MTNPFFNILSIDELSDGSALVAADMDIETLKKFAAIGIIQTMVEAVEDFEEELLTAETLKKPKSSKRRVAKKPNAKTKRKAA